MTGSRIPSTGNIMTVPKGNSQFSIQDREWFQHLQVLHAYIKPCMHGLLDSRHVACVVMHDKPNNGRVPTGGRVM